MAEFPIQYSEKIPSVQTSSRMADIGGVELASAYAQRGAGIAELGRDIFQMALTIQKQEDVAEFSELKRNFDETGFAAFNAITGDETADSKIIAKFLADSETLQSKRGNVNNMLRQHINEVMPEWEDNFTRKSLGIRRQNVKDKFELEAENLLGQGNLPEYYKQLNTRLVLQDITQAEFDFRVANAPNDSLLQQMRMSIGNGTPQGAIELAKQMKDASADQMDYRDKLIAMAQQDLKANSDEIQTNILFDMATRKDTSLSEKGTIANDYRKKLSISGISPERAGVMLDRINKWETGQDTETNPQMKAALTTQILGIWASSGDIEVVKQNIANNAHLLSSNDYTALMKLADEKIEASQSKVLSNLVSDLTRADSLWYNPDIVPEFQTTMLQWIAKNPKATSLDILKKGREVMQDWQEKMPEDIFSEVTKGVLTPVQVGTVLDKDTAIRILREVGGNKELARQRAKELGYAL